MKKRASNLLALTLFFLPAAVFAHSGHANHGFIDGLIHPFLGMDHLLAMLVVGIWSVLRARSIWLAPLSFVAMLTVGAVLGQNGLSAPQLEPLVAASVLVFGLMIALSIKLKEATSLTIIGGFALFHGMAHGGELSGDYTVLSGIVLGSALLHGLGMSFAHAFLKQHPQLAKRLGQLVAVLGGGLVLSVMI